MSRKMSLSFRGRHEVRERWGRWGGGGGRVADASARPLLEMCEETHLWQRGSRGRERLSAPKARRRFSRRGATWFTNVCTSSSFRPFKPFFSLAAAKAQPSWATRNQRRQCCRSQKRARYLAQRVSCLQGQAPKHTQTNRAPEEGELNPACPTPEPVRTMDQLSANTKQLCRSRGGRASVGKTPKNI